MASLDDVRDDYADENLPVFLLLGLVSALRRLEPLLPPVDEPPPGSPGPAHTPAPGSGRFVYLVLGLVAFRRNLVASLPPPCEAAASGGPATEEPAPGLPSLRELLR
jgi:hypothetical protein